MIKRILFSSGAIIATVGLSGSLAFAGTISNTGKGSLNGISSKNITLCTSVNNNKTGVTTVTAQGSKTGKSKVVDNTTGGSSKSGNASNTSTNGLAVSVTNSNACDTTPTLLNEDVSSGSGGSTIDTTGKGSVNVISSTKVNATKVVNNNSTSIETVTLQGASSGDSITAGNTTGGSSTSGNASNSSSTTTTLTVKND